MRNKIKALALSGAFVLAGGVANAATINVPVSNSVGAFYKTEGITAFNVTGNDMAGMKVTAFFAGGTSQTVNWAALAGGVGDDGVAAGTGWVLYEAGQTINSEWGLYNVSALTITKLTIEARAGGVTFDISPLASPEGSPGSLDGNAFRNRDADCGGSGPQCATTNVTGLTATAAYTDALKVGPGPTYTNYGDEFTFLTINFGGTPGGLAANTGTTCAYNPANLSLLAACNLFIFKADTDQASSTIIRLEAPEPMTLALFGTGLVGLGALRRRRKAAK